MKPQYLATLIFSLIMSSYSVAKDPFVPVKKVKEECLDWVLENHGGNKDLIVTSMRPCDRLTEKDKIQAHAYQLCQRFPQGSGDSDSHQIYTFPKCVKAIQNKDFPKDSIEVLKKYIQKDDVYFHIEGFKASAGGKPVSEGKGFVSRLEVAEGCKKWVDQNNMGKEDLAQVALGHCVLTAVSGNFLRGPFDICMALPKGLKSSESHQVYSFGECLKSIKNKSPGKENMRRAIQRCERLPIAPDLVKTQFFEEILEILGDQK